jgi:two-component system NtrC family sensor kinase
VPNSKPTFFWSLRLIAVLSVLAPAVVFSVATWQNRRAIDAQANERIDRALDVLQEHALKALQTVERSISEINEVLRGMSDDKIRAGESDLFLRFKRTQQALPQIESIWAFDRNGHPLVSSTILPVPRQLNNSDRSYFRAQKDTGDGIYVSEVLRGRVGSLWFFVVSGRRQGGQAGQFDGVVAVTVTPEHFAEFYRKLTRGRDTFGMVRSDGALLARFPEARFEGLPAATGLSQAIRNRPESGIYTAVSQIDQAERRVGYRKVPGYLIYVVAGIETGAISREFWMSTLTQFAIGLPAVLGMLLLSLYALRRAQRFQEETARREVAETALKQAQRLEAIGQLTGGVAHDFNNLLMIVYGNVERLKREVNAGNRAKRALEAIETAVQRGTHLTRQLLSFSRRQTHEARILDLKERLPEVREMLQSSLRGDIAVELRIPEGLWQTKVDISEFDLALLNLAVNARDAMSAGGRLTISGRNVHFAEPNALDLHGDFVAVSVEDTGAGIPPDVLGRVFEPFFTTKEVDKGTGLGLSQVYGFAQQAGGTATVASEPGKGTTVTLYLPRSVEQEQERAADDAVDAAYLRRSGLVLLVEDNAEVADVTLDLLEEAGYTSLCATDVASARAILETRKGKIDIVLTDIVMPGGANGLDLARWIRRRDNTLPVVLATGYSDNAQIAADEGFIILRKPYDAEGLRAALDLAVQTRARAPA